MQCSAKTSMRAATTKVTGQVVAVKTPVAQTVSRRSRVVKASAVNNEQGAAVAAAAAAAVLLAASPVIASELPTAVLNPTAEVAESLGAKFNRWFDKVYVDPTTKINEDPFAADKKQSKTVGDTKKNIPIPTEQEAVAPESFPNPASGVTSEPSVLSQAASDERYGPNAGQFKGLTQGDRQGLIDKSSPSTSSN